MLTLYEGGFTSVAHDEIIKAIERSVNGGKRVFYFVPEQQTLTAEAEACDVFPPSAALLFEVTNFTRFTNTAFRTLGGISGEYITSAKKALVMWGVLTELSPMLSITRGAKNITSGTVTKALAAVGELAALGIRPDELKDKDALLSTEDKRLKTKLKDISLIYSLYKTKLSERYADTTEDIIGLSKKLDTSPGYLDGATVFIEGFTSFTEPQYALIRSILKACDVSIALTLRKNAKDSFEYREIRDTERRLARIAKDERCDIRLLTPDARHRDYEPILTDVCDLIWRNEGEIDNDSLQLLIDNPDILRVFEAATPFEECDFIASDIKRRVMDGARYSDFAILARSLESYSGILDTSLSKSGIPHFMATPTSITSFEAIKLISTAYATVIRRFGTAEVLTYVKSGLIGQSKEECDLFELYVTKWGITGSRFTDGELWNMNPKGYKVMEDGDSEKLIRINEIRDKIISPIKSFADRTKDAKTVRDHAEALLDFLIEIGLEDKLEERASELAIRGEVDLAKQNLRLWQIICDSLDTLIDMLGDTPADAESFINQLSVVFSDTNLGSIPSYRDEVTVGKADMARLNDKKHVYLIGVNAGEFPKSVSDTSYFSDRDKAALAKLGLGVTPDLEIKNARELYAFSRSFSVAKRSVTLSYTDKTSSLGSALPSEVIERIREITHGVIRPKPIAQLPLMDKIYSPEPALESIGAATPHEKQAIRNALYQTEYQDVIKVSEGKLENDEVMIDEEAIGIIVGRDIYLSQTKIDKYMKCPFRYFSSTFLGIEENEKAEINQLVVGNFIHSVLESVFGAVIRDRRSLSDLTQSERDDITSRSAKAYVERELGSSSAKNSVIIDRIHRAAKPIVDGLCDEFANCRFAPAYCELKIDQHNPETPSSIVYHTSDAKHRVIIGGYIDRLDTLKVGDDVYVRVVDYKTGIKSFSVDDVKKGENLQMLLYLKSVTETESPEFRKSLGVENDGRLIPAGIVYVKTSVKDITIDKPSDELALSEVKASFERLGISLDSQVSLKAMNPDFIPMGKAKRGEDPKPLTYSEDDWARINDEMKDAVLKIADEITSGHIVAKTNANDNASFHPCTDCQYKFICRNAVK